MKDAIYSLASVPSDLYSCMTDETESAMQRASAGICLLSCTLLTIAGGLIAFT